MTTTSPPSTTHPDGRNNDISSSQRRPWLSSLRTRRKNTSASGVAPSSYEAPLDYERDNDWQRLPWLELLEQGELTSKDMTESGAISKKSSYWTPSFRTAAPSPVNQEEVILVK
ncbi:expressed unknown protein [Seminavis robusta]|uniref:Uncharacterized protein n=1 Tax=Seminavis robusta TaxID=568900 RepID=A0A9N8EJV0_9STRA|nr:expressed unknown protein [Seminavis robusta]|eukprot:Sro1325_g262910.1 n/a (114) ;mRNA; r:14356-14697